MPPLDHDLVIVGSGPAGSATALHLARLAPAVAARTAVLERDRHPREKLCAGGMMPDADRCLAGLGLDPREVPSAEVERMHLLFRGRGATLRGEGDAAAFRVVRRHEFDAWLAGKVRDRGVAVHEETRVTAVRVVGGAVEIQTNRGLLRARAVVGADGSRSVVRRAVRPTTGTGVARTVEVLTPASSPRFPDACCAASDAYMEFREVTRGIEGYSWSFPAVEKGAACRTFGTFDSRVGGGAPGGPLPPVLGAEMEGRGYRLEDHEVEAAPLRWYEPTGRLAAPHLLLAGDAAGVCALFGEGISPALGYGELAAQAVARAFARGDFSFADYTWSVRRSRLGRSLLHRWLLARAIYAVRSPTVLAALFRHGGPVIERVMQGAVFNWAS